MVLLLRESGSVFWYLVYLLFLPSAVVVGAQEALLGFSIGGLPSGGFRPAALATAALIGSTGAPFVSLGLFYSRLGGAALIALVLASVAVACDVALAAWAADAARRQPDR